MTSLPFIDGARLYELVSYTDAIAALERVFLAEPLPDSPQRTVLARDPGQLLVMPSWGDLGAGVKLVTVNTSNPDQGLPLINGVYVLFSPDTLEPVALFDAAPLTALRTASVSALATRYLAPEEASCLVVFGAGVQAEAHVHAIAAVRRLDEVVIVSPREGTGAGLVARLRAEGFPARTGTAADVARADLVCTCTTSASPVFDGKRLAANSHVNAIGSHHKDARELDTASVDGATVVVETVPTALAEAGDVLDPIAEGVLQQSELVELSAAIRAGKGPRGRTVFKSVGVAFEDLAVASEAFRRLEKA